MTGALRIAGGRVYDPRNGVDGEIRDVCIEDGTIVESVPDDAPVLNARGLVVLPGGVDVHCHIAGPKVSLARRLQPERRRWDVAPLRARPEEGVLFRAGTGGLCPSSFLTGYRYAGLGYTTALEAAIPALGARQAHHELADTPILDKAFLLLLGNDEFLLERLAAGEDERAREYVAWMLGATRAYGVKVVNPGGVVAWKDGGAVHGLDEPVPRHGVTPRRIVEALAHAVDELGLPHPMHIHCNDMGLPGNVATTLETMRAVDGHRAHFAHVQFHSYGEDAEGRPASRARDVVAYLDTHPESSADVGQVMFGQATAMTADLPVADMIGRLTGRKWADVDVELESGCGIVPYEYHEKSFVHTVQWATGLELFLLSEDPWRLVLSTDHPNGGSFLAYPRLMRLLMDRTFRDDELKRVNPDALRGTALADGLDREYTLSEIVTITRAGPARLMGLERKGHLGVGADADIGIYTPADDVEAMFQHPRHVLKGGVPVIADGELVAQPWGRTFRVGVDADSGDVEPPLRAFLDERGSVPLDALRIHEEETGPTAVVPAGRR